MEPKPDIPEQPKTEADTGSQFSGGAVFGPAGAAPTPANVSSTEVPAVDQPLPAAPEAPELAAQPSAEVPAPVAEQAPMPPSFSPTSQVPQSIPAEPVVAAIATPTTTPAVPKNSLFSKIRGKKPLFLGLIVAGGLLVVSTMGAFAYFGIIVPNQPNNVLKRSVATLLVDQKDLSFAGTVSIKDKTDNIETLKATLNGGTDEAYNTRVDAEFSFSALKIGGSVIIRPEQQQVYVKINEIPSLIKYYNDIAGSEDGSLTELSKLLNDKWVRLSVADLKEAGYLDEEAAAKAEKCVTAYAKVFKRDDSSQIKKVMETYQNNEFANASKVGSEEVNGVKAAKYKVEIDTKKAGTFFSEYDKIFKQDSKDIAEACGQVEEAASELAGVDQELSASTLEDSTKVTEVHIWVKGKQLVKVNFTIETEYEKTEVSVIFDKKKVDVSVPKNVVTPKELQQSIDKIIGSSAGLYSADTEDSGSSISEKGRDTERQTDIKALHGQLEAYYAQNGLYPLLSEVNDATWRKVNMKGLDTQALRDPSGTATTLASAPAAKIYSYQVYEADAKTVCKVASDCAVYTLTATLEGTSNGSKVYVKESLN